MENGKVKGLSVSTATEAENAFSKIVMKPNQAKIIWHHDHVSQFEGDQDLIEQCVD